MDDQFSNWLTKARDACRDNPDYLAVIDAVVQLVETDDRPYEQMISKLVQITGQSRKQISAFMRAMRSRKS